MSSLYFCSFSPLLYSEKRIKYDTLWGKLHHLAVLQFSRPLRFLYQNGIMSVVWVLICLKRGKLIIFPLLNTSETIFLLWAAGCIQCVKCPFHSKENSYHLIGLQVCIRHLVGNLACHTIEFSPKLARWVSLSLLQKKDMNAQRESVIFPISHRL